MYNFTFTYIAFPFQSTFHLTAFSERRLKQSRSKRKCVYVIKRKAYSASSLREPRNFSPLDTPDHKARVCRDVRGPLQKGIGSKEWFPSSNENLMEGETEYSIPSSWLSKIKHLLDVPLSLRFLTRFRMMYTRLSRKRNTAEFRRPPLH